MALLTNVNGFCTNQVFNGVYLYLFTQSAAEQKEYDFHNQTAIFNSDDQNTEISREMCEQQSVDYLWI